jgi:hypothetical protein
MKIFKTIFPLVLVVALSFGLMGGCGGGGGCSNGGGGGAGGGNGGGGNGGGGGGTNETINLLIDASAGGVSAEPGDPANKYTYLDLSAGEVVDLTDEQAQDSTNWDIAFKRSTVILNGGVSGPGAVSGFFTGNNSEAYDSNGDAIFDWFAAATADSELEDFEIISSSDVPLDGEGNPDASVFTSDVPSLVIVGDGTSEGWWLYDFQTHVVSANPDSWWIIRSDTGETYVKFHVTEIAYDITNQIFDITIESVIQNAGETSFTTPHTATFSIPEGGGSVYFDYETLAPVPSSADWDLRVGYDPATRLFSMYTNGGLSGPGSGGAFPIGNEPDAYTNGADTSQIPFYFTDSAGGIFVDSIWYAYNLTGNDHQLWPNYRVYLIQTEGEVYKFQILSYYHPQTTQSGWFAVRFEKVFP